MIIFDLSCEFEHRFEGWFDSSESFDRQLADAMLCCPQCGSRQVRRVPSATHFSVAKKPHEPTGDGVNIADVFDAAVRALIANSEDVGPGFAEEARRIHYLESEPRQIHGQSSDEEFEALRDEGIEVWRLPYRVRRPH